MVEHIALGIAIYYAVFYWWRWSVWHRRYVELNEKVAELFAEPEQEADTQ